MGQIDAPSPGNVIPDLSRNRVNLFPFSFFLGSADSSQDLALLASCNHTIQSYGSFSYFAGFLANGLRIIPEHFAEYRTEQHLNIPILRENPLEVPLPDLYFFDYL